MCETVRRLFLRFSRRSDAMRPCHRILLACDATNTASSHFFGASLSRSACRGERSGARDEHRRARATAAAGRRERDGRCAAPRGERAPRTNTLQPRHIARREKSK